MKRILLLAIILVTSLTITGDSAIYSKDIGEVGLAVKPALTEVAVKPGESKTIKIDLQNISGKPVGVTIGSRSLLPNDPEIDQNRRKDYDASAWIDSLDKTILLDINQTKTIDILLNVPEKAGPGGHYTLITYRTVHTDSDPAKSSGTEANPELTTALFVTVSGLIDEQADIIVSDLPRLNFGRKLNVEAFFSNFGNIHLLPTTEVEILNNRGETVSVTRISPELTLPNTIKKLEAQINDLPKFGRHKIRTKITYGSPSQQKIVTSKTFWIAPSATAMLTYGFFATMFVAAIAFFKRWPKAIRKLAGKPLKLTKETTKKTKAPQDNSRLKARQLDELAKDTRIKNQPKTRRPLISEIRPAEPKDEIFSRKNHRDYIDKIKRK